MFDILTTRLLVRRYRKAYKCVNSKPALMVLVWSYFMGVVYAYVTSLSSYQIPVKTTW